MSFLPSLLSSDSLLHHYVHCPTPIFNSPFSPVFILVWQKANLVKSKSSLLLHLLLVWMQKKYNPGWSHSDFLATNVNGSSSPLPGNLTTFIPFSHMNSSHSSLWNRKLSSSTLTVKHSTPDFTEKFKGVRTSKAPTYLPNPPAPLLCCFSFLSWTWSWWAPVYTLDPLLTSVDIHSASEALQPRQHIKKQRHYFAYKGPPSQSYGFSSSHVWMCELDYKESWALKN